MASVLILSLVFPPDQVSTAQIMGDIALDLKARGHEVSVITTNPHYNPLAEEGSAHTPGGRDAVIQKRDFNGIDVYHTRMKRKSGSIFSRGMSYLMFHVLSLFAGLFLVKRPDIILAPSPPLTIALCEWILGARYGVPFIYNVQEIYPDIAIDMGAIRSQFVARLLFKLERFIYRRAARLTIINEQMRQRIRDKGVPEEKLLLIPNFVNTAELLPMPKRNAFSLQHGIEETFVVSYAGNLGPAQSLDEFVQAASILRGDDSIQFLMLGDGILRQDLESQAERLGLTNMLILSYQPFELMQQIYAASDLSLVPQSPAVGFTSMPSKVYRIMACGRPVLAYADPASEIATLIANVDCGIFVPVGHPDALATAIRLASQDREALKAKGLNGRKHVEEHYARGAVTERYHKLILDLLEESK